ncbi:MAG: tetratricopeptide repeat protein [Candidatus Moranbacteria bacterium]|nr:tetratricopeptide repeat protein [Candidatus Moranbacteria bacterium]
MKKSITDINWMRFKTTKGQEFVVGVDFTAEDAFIKAKELRQEGKAIDALGVIDVSLYLDWNRPAAHNIKASILLTLKRFGEAISSCDEAIRLNPNLAESFNNKAVILKASENYEDALTLIEKALDLNPDNPALIYNKESILEALRNQNGLNRKMG